MKRCENRLGAQVWRAGDAAVGARRAAGRRRPASSPNPGARTRPSRSPSPTSRSRSRTTRVRRCTSMTARRPRRHPAPGRQRRLRPRRSSRRVTGPRTPSRAPAPGTSASRPRHGGSARRRFTMDAPPQMPRLPTRRRLEAKAILTTPRPRRATRSTGRPRTPPVSGPTTRPKPLHPATDGGFAHCHSTPAHPATTSRCCSRSPSWPGSHS